jgi:hypothetical protein
MSLIANKFNPKKLVALGLLAISLIGGTSAFALASISTATLDNSRYASGGYVNIWDGGIVSAYNLNDNGNIVVRIKKVVPLFPDSTQWSYTLYTNSSIYRKSVFLEASTFYIEAESNNPYSHGGATLENSK